MVLAKFVDNFINCVKLVDNFINYVKLCKNMLGGNPACPLSSACPMGNLSE